MYEDLLYLVQMTKLQKEEESIELLSNFKPLINKYSWLLDGEDTKQDLKLHFLKAVKRMPLKRFREKNNRVIFSYLAKSLKYEFIRLSKQKRKKADYEIELKVESYEDETALNSEIEFLEMMKVLTKKETFVIDCIYVNCLSSSEVAQYLGVTRQAVNQTKKKALEKIKKHYLKEDIKKESNQIRCSDQTT